MRNPLIDFFRPPTFPGNEEKTRTAFYLNAITTVAVPLLLALLIARTDFGVDPLSTIILGVMILLLFATWLLTKLGHIRPASYLLVGLAWMGSALLAYTGDGVRGTGFASLMIAVFLAGLLIGARFSIAVALITVAYGFILAAAETAGLIHFHFDPVFATASEAATVFLVTAILIYLTINEGQNALKRARQNAEELENSNNSLMRLQATLEARVEDRTAELARQTSELEAVQRSTSRRTAQLEALAQATRSITSIRDLRELLPNIARVISEQFGFYHVGIFLLDDANEFAILSAANSEGGRKMLENKHRLQVGEEGIVGHVAMTGKVRIAMDVGRDAAYFDNPFLPDTHSEMALPLKSGNRAIGVLDVQSTEVEAFTAEDVQLLSLLADQVSLAIENARLFDATQRSLAEAEAFSHQYLRESWGRLAANQDIPGYRYSATGVAPISAPKNLMDDVRSGNGGQKTEANQVRVPIELRGEKIGTLVVNPLRERNWTQDELDLIKAVADRVALAAENARLFEETTRRAERERLVSEITGKIRSNTDPQSMIQTAVEELRNVLGASRVEVVPQKLRNQDKP